MKSVTQKEWAIAIGLAACAHLIWVGIVFAVEHRTRSIIMPLWFVAAVSIVWTTIPIAGWLASRQRLQIHPSRLEAYRAATRALNSVAARKGENTIWAESIDKNSDVSRMRDKRNDTDVIKFHAAMTEKIRSGDWSVRYLIRAHTEEMLEENLKFYVEPYKACRNYQVRVITLDRMLDTMSPLIIGESDVLLGFGQDASRTDSCFHLHDRAAAKLAKTFYDLLWTDPSGVTVKSGEGVDEGAIQNLRHKLRQSLADRTT